MPPATRLRRFLILLVVLTWPSAALWAQESSGALPEVIEHAAPLYPPLARQARIQGEVRLRVTTNGHVVTDVAVKEGHPLLVQSAEDSVRQWKFVDHVPGTFDVTFKFRVLDFAGTFLQQPGIVEVATGSRGGVGSYTLPEKWNAQIRNAQGTIRTTLTLWTYRTFESKLDGYTTGSQGQEREIREPHIDGDMLGFDTRIEDKFGQRLKFSMIGKRTGEKIKGVFLNYWGQGGEWTAERAAEADPEVSSVHKDETPITASDVAYHESVEIPSFIQEAGIQGTVHLQVTTDGYSVSEIDAESGNPFLIRASTDNLRTWRFANHAPRAFDVVYSYQLLDSKVEFFKRPGEVEIDSLPPLVDWYDANIYVPPSTWQMQLANSHGKMLATLSLGTSYDRPDGYVISEVDGPAGKKEEILQSHQDGDMLGFDATVKGPDGRPLRISVIGNKDRKQDDRRIS